MAQNNYRNQACRSSDKDELKCMVCTMAFEANLRNRQDLINVGQVIMQRVESRDYPGTICKVVWQRRQFVGLREGRKLEFDDIVMNGIVAAAKTARGLGGNGYLGFRSCDNGRRNCLRRMGQILLDGPWYDDPFQLAGMLTEDHRTVIHQKVEEVMSEEPVRTTSLSEGSPFGAN